MKHSMFVLLFLMLLTGTTLYAQDGSFPHQLTVDVVPDLTTFSFVDIDSTGGPTPGDPFVVEGAILRENTGESIGTYLCRGFWIQVQEDGDFTYVTQSFEIDGEGTIYVLGNETGAGPHERSISGATGRFLGLGRAAVVPMPTADNPFIFRITFHFGMLGPPPDIDTSTSTETPVDFNSGVSLSRNHPNPFSPESGTEIHVTLSHPGRLTARVYNVLGQQVQTLAEGDYPAGTHLFRWDGKDARGNTVASGLYFFLLGVDGFVTQEAMVAVR